MITTTSITPGRRWEMRKWPDNKYQWMLIKYQQDTLFDIKASIGNKPNTVQNKK